MKKITLVTIIILALLISMLPVSTAFAAKAAPETQIQVFNHTKGEVNLSLTDAKGFHYFFSFADAGTNMYAEVVPQGQYYSFYLVTRCNTIAGVWNMSKNRILDLYCPGEGLDPQFNGPVIHVVTAM